MKWKNKSVYLASIIDRFYVKNNESYNPENKISKLMTRRNQIEHIPN